MASQQESSPFSSGLRGSNASSRDDAEDRQRQMQEARLRSRQTYLQRREEDQLSILRETVREEYEEERRLGDRLTASERREFAKHRETLRLAEARRAVDDHDEGYALPEDFITEKGKIDVKRKADVLNRRFVDHRARDDRFVTEHEEWEQEQTSRAHQDQTRTSKSDDQYEFVFDNASKINFVGGQALPAEKKNSELTAQLDAAERKVASIEQVRQKLPVYAYRKEFLGALEQHQVLIVVGETGSGKTTQLPQYLFEAGYCKQGKIAITQPRRVAAMSVAARVAEEMQVRLGEEVGYSIRFENKTSEKTKLNFCTDGHLVRELIANPDLSEYSVIMLDEVHERTVSTDVLVGLLSDIRKANPSLKIICSSATLNAQKLSSYWAGAPILNIPGRRFPVEILHVPSPEANYIAATVTTIWQIHLSMPLPGDILAFLTGQEEIEACETLIAETAQKLGSKAGELMVCPVFANLEPAQQARIFETTPPGVRKVVLATNIAETSITIDQITYVIDPGVSKLKTFDARSGLEALSVQTISKASAGQRGGRAGRTGPGKCFRLYTKWSYRNELPESTEPELLRSDLTSVMLMMKALGINNVLDFDFMDSPPSDSIIRALEQLYTLGAFNDRGEITKVGRKMAGFPIECMSAKAILMAEKYGCVQEVITILSMLSISGALFYTPKDKKMLASAAHKRFQAKEGGGDHLTLLNIYNEYADTDWSYAWCRENFLQQRSLERARQVRDQLEQLCEQSDITLSSSGANDQTSILKAITAGYFSNAARLTSSGDGSYQTVKGGRTMHIHPSSVLVGEGNQRPRWVIYHEAVLTSKEFMRNVAEIDPSWLVELSPHFHNKKSIEALGGSKGTKRQGPPASKF
ncbi:MAG: hypothetical protein M1820_008277 [Bogoriella megaspora]|nr:MAG: hypothetical protein M1820_008277 [Bogoriella megaspora]